MVEGVESLSFDWISKNLYWTEASYKSVSVMRLADKSRREIIKNVNNPRSIVVHPIAGWVCSRLLKLLKSNAVGIWQVQQIEDWTTQIEITLNFIPLA